MNIREILSTDTLKQSLLTSSSTIINGILGAIFYIVLARNLGPSDFGIITLTLATLTLIADIADLGTNTGIVRFVPSKINSEKAHAYRFLKLSLIIKLFVWAAVLILGISLSGFIAKTVFGKSELEEPLKFAMFGVGSALLFSFATSTLQAFQKFKQWGFVNILTNGLRLLLVLVLLAAGFLDLRSSLLIYVLLPLFGFFVALLILPSRKIILAKNSEQEFKELFRYNGWVSIFILMAAFSSRMDIFLTGKLLNTNDVGIYGAANQLVQALPQLVSALGVVVAPKFASYKTNSEMLVYFKKLQKFVLGISAVILVLLPAAFFLIPLILGNSYLMVFPIFTILVLSNLVFLISVPVHNSIFYYFSKPQVFVWVSFGHLLIVTIIGFVMISNFGTAGAAWTVFLGTLFNFMAPLAWFLRKIR